MIYLWSGEIIFRFEYNKTKKIKTISTKHIYYDLIQSVITTLQQKNQDTVYDSQGLC